MECQAKNYRLQRQIVSAFTEIGRFFNFLLNQRSILTRQCLKKLISYCSAFPRLILFPLFFFLCIILSWAKLSHQFKVSFPPFFFFQLTTKEVKLFFFFFCTRSMETELTVFKCSVKISQWRREWDHFHHRVRCVRNTSGFSTHSSPKAPGKCLSLTCADDILKPRGSVESCPSYSTAYMWREQAAASRCRYIPADSANLQGNFI